MARGEGKMTNIDRPEMWSDHKTNNNNFLNMDEQMMETKNEDVYI